MPPGKLTMLARPIRALGALLLAAPSAYGGGFGCVDSRIEGVTAASLRFIEGELVHSEWERYHGFENGEWALCYNSSTDCTACPSATFSTSPSSYSCSCPSGSTSFHGGCDAYEATVVIGHNSQGFTYGGFTYGGNNIFYDDGCVHEDSGGWHDFLFRLGPGAEPVVYRPKRDEAGNLGTPATWGPDMCYQLVDPGFWPTWGRAPKSHDESGNDLSFGHWGALGYNAQCHQGYTYEGEPSDACGGEHNWGTTEMEVWYRVGDASEPCQASEHAACAADEAACKQPHPAAVCALPAQGVDDNDALRPGTPSSLGPSIADDLSILSYRFCHDCACLQEHELCDELAVAYPALATVCALSCAPPRTVDERDCVGASLPTASWSDRGAPNTPQQQYPSVREACQAGPQGLVRRTQDWLDLAQDYMLQAAEGNAGLIAQQLCLEREWEGLACLGDQASACQDDDNWETSYGDCDSYRADDPRSYYQYCDTDASTDDGRTASEACPVACGTCLDQSENPLVALHDQACDLAAAIGRSHAVTALLTSSDVRPLTMNSYHAAFDNVGTFVSGTLVPQREQLDDQTFLLETIAQQTEAIDVANAVDEQGLWQDKVDADSARMQQYRTQIASIDGTIQQILASMAVDGPSMLDSVSEQITASRLAFVQASGGTTALNGDELTLLRQTIADLTDQRDQLQRQIKSQQGRRRVQSDDETGLAHRLEAIVQRLARAQLQLQLASADSNTPSPCATFSSDCAGPIPPSSNGCGTDFTGAQHSWAMQALQDLTGCYAVPPLLNDMVPCCDAHDICYGSCGVTQEFCDTQLHDCMQAQATFGTCQTAIDTADLAVSLLGCDHFTSAQDNSVQPSCQNSDNAGCAPSSCSDAQNCFHTAEDICDTVGGIAGAVAASPLRYIPGVPALANDIDLVAGAASAAISAVESAWDTVSGWFGRRRLGEELQGLEAKMRSAKKLITTATSLATLSAQIAPEDSDSVDSTTLPKLDMSFLDLDMLDDEVLVNSIQGALGDNEATYEVEIRQVVTLIRNKLQQMRSYYQAALSKQSNEQQRDLLGRRAQRAASFVQDEQDQAAQLQAASQFFDAKIRAYTHVQLQYLIEEIRAYEYQFLVKYTQFSLDELIGARMDAVDFHAFVQQAETQLQIEYTRQHGQHTNGGSGNIWSHAEFAVSDDQMPIQRAEFLSNGKLTLTITLPEHTSYYGVTFTELRVFLIGLPDTANSGNNIVIDVVNVGSSTFLDESGSSQTFTHDRTNPPYRFLYDPTSCAPRSAAFPDLDYIRYSPYASWELSVQQARLLDLSLVTAVRFEFLLSGNPSSTFGSEAVFFVDSDGTSHDSEGAAALNTCHATAALDQCASCTSYPEFDTCTDAVTDECCNEPDEDCSSGEPATCNVGCAAVLLPMIDTCDDYLTTDPDGIGAYHLSVSVTNYFSNRVVSNSL